MTTTAIARLKRVRAVELAAEGRNYDEIAREVGYSHRGSAHRAVTKALDERSVDAVDELRTSELQRLDELQTTLWDSALRGDLPAINAVLRIIETRIRLLGLSPDKSRAAHGKSAPLVRPGGGNPGEATDHHDTTTPESKERQQPCERAT